MSDARKGKQKCRERCWERRAGVAKVMIQVEKGTLLYFFNNITCCSFVYLHVDPNNSFFISTMLKIDIVGAPRLDRAFKL